ncbi:chondroitin proteoglycan 2-like [Channa argus]|uniref:chondroitin proteoglycan 2-like n=1 Tax=Channa argus TaxID=215402 RepID=UPI00352134D4
MCRLILTAGLCLIIAVLASATPIDQFCNGKKNGDYANPNDPNSYITCSNGLTYVRYCQAGLIFRESLDICDWPTTTSFNSTLKTTTKPTTPGPVDQFCKGKRDGDYTNPKNKYTFYTCSNGLTYLRDCPAGLIFRQCLDRCDGPTTPCFTTPKTTTKPTTPGPVNQFCKGKSDGDYTNPKNQYTFYTCSNGLTYLKNCPAGLIFRECLDMCDWPTTPAPIGCNSSPKTTTTAQPAGSIDQFCKGKRDGDYTNPKNKYTFYTCSNGLTYLRDCPAGLIFRQCLDRCDGPTTPCFTTPKTTTKPTTPGPVNQFCKGKSDGDYTNPKNQYTFYTCSNGLTYLRDCPAGLIFNQVLDRCE